MISCLPWMMIPPGCKVNALSPSAPIEVDALEVLKSRLAIGKCGVSLHSMGH